MAKKGDIFKSINPYFNQAAVTIKNCLIRVSHDINQKRYRKYVIAMKITMTFMSDLSGALSVRQYVYRNRQNNNPNDERLWKWHQKLF